MSTLNIEGRDHRTYLIEEGGLRIQLFKNRKLPTEEFVAFESIKRDRFFHSERAPLFLVFGGVCLVLCILVASADASPGDGSKVPGTSVFGLLRIVFCVAYFVYNPKLFYLKTFTEKYIKFPIKNNEEEIGQFVDELIQRRDEYIMMKYGKPNLYFSCESQFSNFSIMHRESMITTKEYQEKIAALNRIFNQTAPKSVNIGYSQN